MLAFKVVHRRGADRTPHCLAQVKHREINDHPIEVVAQYFASLQRHCKSSVLNGLIVASRPALRDVRVHRVADAQFGEPLAAAYEDVGKRRRAWARRNTLKLRSFPKLMRAPLKLVWGATARNVGRRPNSCSASRYRTPETDWRRGLRRGQRAYVLNWLFKARGSGHAPDSIAAPSGTSANSHDRCRYAFGHVICADVDALQARPPSNGR